MKLERICEMAEAELEELMQNGRFRSASDVDTAYKLTSMIKNVKKIMGGYSNDDGSYRDSYRGSYNSYEGSYDGSYDDMSNARGRRNAPRDAMGRYSGEGYSRHGEMVQRLKRMLNEAEGTEREALERCISHIEG